MHIKRQHNIHLISAHFQTALASSCPFLHFFARGMHSFLLNPNNFPGGAQQFQTGRVSS